MKAKKEASKVVVPGGCPECNGDLAEAIRPFSHGEVFFGNYLFWVCSRCGFEVVPPDTAHLLERVAKAKGVWGVKAPVLISQNHHVIGRKITAASSA